jgi:hypothetical protein
MLCLKSHTFNNLLGCVFWSKLQFEFIIRLHFKQVVKKGRVLLILSIIPSKVKTLLISLRQKTKLFLNNFLLALPSLDEMENEQKMKSYNLHERSLPNKLDVLKKFRMISVIICDGTFEYLSNGNKSL